MSYYSARTGVAAECGQRELDVQYLRHILEVEPMEIVGRLDLRVREKEGIHITPRFLA